MDWKQQDKYEKLGWNVCYYRKQSKLTQEQLAELLDIDRTHMCNIELARSGVSLDIIFRLSDVLKIPVHRFFEFRD